MAKNRPENQFCHCDNSVFPKPDFYQTGIKANTPEPYDYNVATGAVSVINTLGVCLIKVRYATRCAVLQSCRGFDVVVVVMLIPWVLDKGPLRYTLRCLTIVSWF